MIEPTPSTGSMQPYRCPWCKAIHEYVNLPVRDTGEVLCRHCAAVFFKVPGGEPILETPGQGRRK